MTKRIPLQGHVNTLDFRGRRVNTHTMATVSLTPAAAEQLDRLPKNIHARVNRLLERLRKWPDVSGAKPLTGKLAGWYRLRTGAYRLRFRVKGEAVIVDKIGHRREFYDD